MVEQHEPIAVLRVSEASTALAIDEDEVRRLLHSGELRGYRTGNGNGHWRIPHVSIAKYARRRCDETAADRGAVTV